jgi:hypothetical protein
VQPPRKLKHEGKQEAEKQGGRQTAVPERGEGLSGGYRTKPTSGVQVFRLAQRGKEDAQ